MRKLQRAAICLLVIVIGFSSTQCFPEDDLVPICYYGVTQMVSPKIAKRYVKIGATMGICGLEPTPPQEPY